MDNAVCCNNRDFLQTDLNQELLSPPAREIYLSNGLVFVTFVICLTNQMLHLDQHVIFVHHTYLNPAYNLDSSANNFTTSAGMS